MGTYRRCKRSAAVSLILLLSCVTAQKESGADNASVLKDSFKTSNTSREQSLLGGGGGVSGVSPSSSGASPAKRVQRQTTVDRLPPVDLSEFERGLGFGETSFSLSNEDPLLNKCGLDLCLPATDCSTPVDASFCTLTDGSAGVCCPLPGVRPNSPLLLQQSQQFALAPVPDGVQQKALEDGVAFLKDLNSLETVLFRNKIFLGPSSPESSHQRFFRVTPSALTKNEAAMVVNQASSSLAQELNLSKDQSIHGLRQVTISDSIKGNVCPAAPVCKIGAKYRTIDGSCNNKKSPLMGKSETALHRLVPPTYDDGVSQPRRRSVTNFELPNVREVSHDVIHDRDHPDPQFTLSVMQWGQFLDHDLTHSPFQAMKANGEGIECCRDGKEITGPERHPKCLPISIPSTDSFYGPRGVSCLNFIRSMQAVNNDCTFGAAEQMNMLTHWLDGSNVYGSTVENADRLRLRQRGLLKTSAGNLLPIDDTLTVKDCKALLRGSHCYFAGDSRVNEQPSLAAIHTLWHREHNRVATALGAQHPDWSDEALYQEARRVVVAELQHITYNEWLPIVLGERFMESYNLKSKFGELRYDYNSIVNPTIMNEFATAAFRFGHTLVQGNVKMQLPSGEEFIMHLRETFMSPHIFTEVPGALDMLSKGLFQYNAQTFDAFVTKDLSNHLFQTPEHDFGMDLMSLNLHRGREHGIALYNQVREVCGLPRARTFADFGDHIPQEVIQRMEALYFDVDDVDLFVGGLTERPVTDGLLGWTFLCIVGEQFQKLRTGDRFFYDVGGEPSSFNKAQLEQIQQSSWARILCDNTDNIGAVQPLAFRLIDGQNQLTDCTGPGIPRVDLWPWFDEQPQV